MRDILFKAKRMDDGEWVEGYYCEGTCNSNCGISLIITELNVKTPYRSVLPSATDIEDIRDFDIYEVDEETICQYTGIKDKNGKEIYEGDIVKFDEYEYEKLVQSIISEIKWCEELCSLSLVVSERQGTRGTLSHLFDYNKEVEVIGNIFDNPKLLNYANNETNQQAYQEVLKSATE